MHKYDLHGNAIKRKYFHGGIDKVVSRKTYIDSCLCFLTDQIQQSPMDETKEDEKRQESKDQIKI